jgi:hypothetical protein
MRKSARLFSKQRIATNMKVSKEYFQGMDVHVGQADDDMIQDQLTIQLEAFFTGRMESVRRINVYHKRPTFWQWLTRKHVSISVDVYCMEVLSMSPNKKNAKLYEVKQANV